MRPTDPDALSMWTYNMEHVHTYVNALTGTTTPISPSISTTSPATPAAGIQPLGQVSSNANTLWAGYSASNADNKSKYPGYDVIETDADWTVTTAQAGPGTPVSGWGSNLLPVQLFGGFSAGLRAAM